MASDPTLEATDLVCWKVAGGNMRIQRAVAIPGLRGVLHSFPLHSDRGGDLHYLSACGSGAIARVCIADVTGHGEEVAEFSGWLEIAFSAHIHRGSPAGVLHAVNKRAEKRGLELMSTGICFSYNSLNGTLRHCCAGHPPMHLRRVDGTDWEPLPLPPRDSPWNLPIGIDGGARFDVAKVWLQPGDQILLHTDGLTEAQDAHGRLFGKTMWSLPCFRAANMRPEDRARGLLEAWTEHIGGVERAEDDLTFAVLECQPFQKGNRYTLFAQNHFSRKA